MTLSLTSPRGSSLPCLWFILLTTFISSCFSSPWLQLGENGYTSLVVAVHPSVPEQKQFVEKLQNLLISTSSALYSVTSKKFFFGEVIIILPITWTNEFHNLPEIGDIYSRADIRIYESGGPSLPYCVQYDDCGKQGRYIQFTASFVQSANNSSGELLMQEFSRYRYGIFDSLTLKDDSEDPVIFKTQGIHCNGQNRWNVIFDHPDSHHYRELHEDSNMHHYKYEPHPSFKLYRTRRESKYMLVFDTSRTLWENPGAAYAVANLTLMRLVREFLPDDSLVGFITFSDTVNVMRGLTELSKDVRDSFFQGLQLEFTGTKQALANAIAKATEVLKEAHYGTKIIVVSDGNNDVAPPLENIVHALQENMISVSMLSPKIRHEANLNILRTATGGSVYFLSSDWMSSTDTQTSVLDHLSESTGSGDIQVYSGDVLISQNMTYDFNVHIDRYLGERTRFEFVGDHLEESGINIFIVSGSKIVYSLKNATRHQSVITFWVNDETGNWTVVFANPARLFSNVHLRVTSRPLRQDLKVPVLESWIEVQRDINYSTVRIFGDIHEGSYAITNVHVTAIVKTPNGEEIITLKDNGTGADITADDGIYSAYFTKFNEDGVYTVLTFAESNNNSRIHGRERSSRNSKHGGNDDKAEYLTRYKYAGAFTILDYQSGMNKIPPSQVRDLAACQDESDPSAINITWTAPGSDFDTGTVTIYDLRMGFQLEDGNELSQVFKTWLSVTSANLINGTLDPLPSGSKQIISIGIPQYSEMNGKTIYLALRSQDVNGNPSKISNVATLIVKFQKSNHSMAPTVGISEVQEMTPNTTTVTETFPQTEINFEIPVEKTSNNFDATRESSTTFSTSTFTKPISTFTAESSSAEQTSTTTGHSPTPEILLNTPVTKTDNAGKISTTSSKTLPPMSSNTTLEETTISVNVSVMYETTPISASSMDISSSDDSFTNHVHEITTETKTQNASTSRSVILVSLDSAHTTEETTIAEDSMTVSKKQFQTEDLNFSDVATSRTDARVENTNESFYEQKLAPNISITTDNEIDTEGIISEDQMATAMKKAKTFSEVNVNTSTMVAAWIGGFCLTFFVIAGIAMMVRSWAKRSKYDIGKMEESSTNSATEELLYDDSTVTVEESF